MSEETAITTGRGSRSSATREKILDAALALFSSQGFDATATKDIAERAGVPNGLIFYHFSTKDELLEALFRERNVLHDLERALESVPRDDPRTMLAAIGREFHDILTERDELVQLLLREVHSGRPISRRFREMRESGIGMVAGLLDAHIKQGLMRPVDTLAMARLFMSGIVLTAVADKPRDPEQYIRSSVDIVLTGFVEEQ